MSIAIAVKHMIEAGLSADAVAAAVADMEAALKPARSKGAIRQARYRQRQQASRIVTSDANDAQNVTGDVSPLSPSPLSSPQTPQHTPHPHTPEIIHSARVKADPFPKPDWADAATWADFLKNRKAKRKPNTASSYAAFLRDVSREAARCGKSPPEILRRCTEQGWAGIYEMKENDDGQSAIHSYRPNRTKGGEPRPNRRKDGFSAAVRTVAGGSAAAANANER